MTSGVAVAGEAFHSAAIAPSLASQAATPKTFHASAASVAPFLRAADGEWYHRLGASAGLPGQAASLEARTAAATRLAELMAEKPAAAPDQPPVAGATSTEVEPKKAGAIAALAFADPSPKAEGGALAAIRSMSQDTPTDDGGIDVGALEIDIENVPLPVARPTRDETVAPPSVAKAVAPATGPVASLPPPVAPETPRDAPAAVEKAPSGGFFKRLFGGGSPRAGNKVAVYDISAAKVYMPDGSVLEAHSGIGEMADNPRFTHVRMNGPTPPQTYDLKMRESRFHGVEAVRMLPVGDQPMHGRTGILTHSYLLRGRAGQSHGCVAFKEYHRFLAAFKRGSVKRIIVVPGGGAGAFARANSKPGDDA